MSDTWRFWLTVKIELRCAIEMEFWHESKALCRWTFWVSEFLFLILQLVQLAKLCSSQSHWAALQCNWSSSVQNRLVFHFTLITRGVLQYSPGVRSWMPLYCKLQYLKNANVCQKPQLCTKKRKPLSQEERVLTFTFSSPIKYTLTFDYLICVPVV